MHGLSKGISWCLVRRVTGKAKAAAAAAGARQEATLALSSALAPLLRKFQTDAVKVPSLPSLLAHTPALLHTYPTAEGTGTTLCLIRSPDDLGQRSPKG